MTDGSLLKEYKMKEKKITNKHKSGTISRRDFMGGTAAAMAFTIIPSHVLAQPPSGKVNVAAIGSGGMGGGNTRACAAAGRNGV